MVGGKICEVTPKLHHRFSNPKEDSHQRPQDKTC
ncbi:hypothetical protein SOVF_137720 isoform A [Spinacia oleracea]|nr:hypothetical protein SOVF_137720 isoform A [Spinacia oleracea]